MSIALLVQASQEMRRLAIAGSALARDDFRVKKLIEPLKVNAQKAPVFGKVAASLEQLLEAPQKESAKHLLSTSTLINAVLYTQSKTGAPGDLHPIVSHEFPISKTASAKRLRPVIEALSTSGSGRYEIIVNAFKDGIFSDYRLMLPCVGGLSDGYTEVADLISDTILPSYGDAVLPILTANLDLKGGRVDARRLWAIGKIQGETGFDLYVDAAENGSQIIKIAAISCLEPFDNAIGLIKELCLNKNKEVRAAALSALGSRGGKDVVELLINALSGIDFTRARAPIKLNKDKTLTAKLLQEARRQFDLLLKKKELSHTDVDRFIVLLECFEGKEDDSVYDFIIDLIKSSKIEKLRPTSGYFSGEDIVEKAVSIIINGGASSVKFLPIIYGKLGKCKAYLASSCTLAAHRALSPSDFYDHMAPLLKLEKKNYTKKQLGVFEALNRCFTPATYATTCTGVDSRWLTFFNDSGQYEYVALLVQPGDTLSIQYIDKMCEFENQTYSALVAMVRAQHPKLAERFCSFIKKLLAGKPHYYHLYRYFGFIQYFPLDAIKQLEALAADVPDNVALNLVDYMTDLKNGYEENNVE